MNRAHQIAPLALAVSMLAVACTNPTVDPASTFTARGVAQDASGQALANAEVRLVRYFHPGKLLRPSVDDLFECSSASCGYDEVDLEIGIVKTTQTDMSGRFEMSFLGEDIAAKGGITDMTGKVEGSNLVLVVIDPSDTAKQAGVFTQDFVFQQADKSWDPGNMRMWEAGADADVSAAVTAGLVNFSWNRIARPAGSTVSNVYRLDVRGGGNRLVLRCQEGVNTIEAGGCTADGDKLQYSVSAFSIFAFYSDAGGAFSGYIQGDGVDLRYRSKFTVSGTIPDPSANRDPIGIEGIWAVTPTANQSLNGTRATDGDTKTREDINGQSTEIYVKLPAGSLVTDAGVLNALVKEASSACIVVEFNTTSFNDVDGAKAGQTGWSSKGKFCGGQGAKNEMSALVSFDTTASMGEVAAWMRFRVEGAGAHFQSVGELAVYKKK